MHSDWLKVVMQLVTSNEDALFQCGRVMLKFVNNICTWAVVVIQLVEGSLLAQRSPGLNPSRGNFSMDQHIYLDTHLIYLSLDLALWIHLPAHSYLYVSIYLYTFIYLLIYLWTFVYIFYTDLFFYLPIFRPFSIPRPYTYKFS